MRENNFVTNFSYLKIPKRTYIPPLVDRLLGRLMYYGVLPFIRLLSPIMGLGFSFKGVKKFPEYRLKMKDGVKLATDVYIPKKAFQTRDKCPTILIRLPYWKDSFNIIGYVYAIHGYAVVLQDVRGCAHSEGINLYLLSDRSDGLETLEWINRQFWYNGKVGMNGGSYFGMTQLCVSFENNKTLTCISPAICSSLNLWNNNNGLEIHSLTTAIYRILINIAVNYEKPIMDIITQEIQERFLNPRSALFNDKLQEKGYLMKFSDFKNLDFNQIKLRIVENYNTKLLDFTKRNYSVYLKYLNDYLLQKKIKKDTHRMLGMLEYDPIKIKQPVFMLAGWQDMFLEQELEDFLELLEKGSGRARKYSKLVIGPWSHADIGHPESKLFNTGMITFYKQFINKSWFDFWLKENLTAFPDIDKPPIKYWVMGRNIWRYEHNWPPNEVKFTKLYLHSAGKANSKEGDGFLDYQFPKIEPLDKYIFDPLNPVITRGGRNLDILKGAQDQRDAEKRNDVLVYTSKLLEKGVEVTGPVKVVLYAASSAKDTDYMVKLVDVFPNGKAYNILDSGIRARYRNGRESPSLIKSNEIIKYSIDLGNTSNLFRKGHRIRIEITSSNFPKFDINSNLGGEGTDKDHVSANQEIFHDKEHPSYFILPIYGKK